MVEVGPASLVFSVRQMRFKDQSIRKFKLVIGQRKPFFFVSLDYGPMTWIGGHYLAYLTC